MVRSLKLVSTTIVEYFDYAIIPVNNRNIYHYGRIAKSLYSWSVIVEDYQYHDMMAYQMYRIYPKYLDTSTPYHICSKI